MGHTYADTSPDTLMQRFVDSLAASSAEQTPARPTKRLRQKTAPARHDHEQER